MRGGKDYDSDWFRRGRGEGPRARLIAVRFARALRRFGLDGPRPPLRTDLFCPPRRQDARQYDLDFGRPGEGRPGADPSI
jgi:hypothetical protein